MMYSWQVLVLLAACLIFNIAGDYFARSWATPGSTENWKLFPAAMFYCVNTPIWLMLLKTVPHLGKMTIAWTIMNILAACFVGTFIFKESMSMSTWMGVVFAILAVVLVAL